MVGERPSGGGGSAATNRYVVHGNGEWVWPQSLFLGRVKGAWGVKGTCMCVVLVFGWFFK